MVFEDVLGVQIPSDGATCVVPCVVLWETGDEVEASTVVEPSVGLETTFDVTFGCSRCFPGEAGFWDENFAVLLASAEHVSATFRSMLTCFSFSFASVESPSGLTSGALDSTSALLLSAGQLPTP